MTGSFEDPVGLEQPAADVLAQRTEATPGPVDPDRTALPLEADPTDVLEQREEIPEDV